MTPLHTNSPLIDQLWKQMQEDGGPSPESLNRLAGHVLAMINSVTDHGPEGNSMSIKKNLWKDENFRLMFMIAATTLALHAPKPEGFIFPPKHNTLN